jgi:hypothetical protein
LRRSTDVQASLSASDDGDTQAMLARDFPDVRVIRHAAPRGPSSARNAGVAAAHGAWMFFWDDDDLTLIQAQHAALCDCRPSSARRPTGETAQGQILKVRLP